MEGARTVGHPAALGAVGSWIRGRAPHAVLLVGPAGIGKTTLALDLAAGLLCSADDRAARPCGRCRACRLVFGGVHPDVHRLGPDGPGRQIVIGGPGAKLRGVRDVVTELALQPAEGGARVAIVTSAQRMNEDAQAALLKTLEEPGPDTTIILCADAEEPLLPTIRSRSARLRLGPVGPRDIETILVGQDVADAPLAARLARIAAGRPGLAVAWARDPAALVARDELARLLLDLLERSPSRRLNEIRYAAVQAAVLAGVTERLGEDRPAPAATAKAGGRGRRSGATGSAGGRRAVASGEIPDPDGPAEPDAEDEDAAPETAVVVPASERRRGAEALVALWTDVARDLALAGTGQTRSLRDLALLDETVAWSVRVPTAAVTAFLDRLGRAGVLLQGNVSPELVLDDLALAWPTADRPAA